MNNNILKIDRDLRDHISFNEMVDYIFSDGRSDEFLKEAARINKHVMECKECYAMYQSLMTLHDSAVTLCGLEFGGERLLTKILSILFADNAGKPMESLIEECLRFKMWLSFSIRNMRELIQNNTSDFSRPRLVTVMKSANGRGGVEETESEIRTSLFDKEKNRVSIGMDGTISLYFDTEAHPVGKRVMILPESPGVDPQMIELMRYDDSISYVRFEGILPGQYTIVVEE